MKNLALLLSLFTVFAFTTSCSDDDDPKVIDSSMPSGSFTSSSSGSLVEENDTGTTGMVSLGTDEDGVEFLKLGSDFETNLGTGTVLVYLSTSATYMADPANGNPDILLIGSIKSNGEQYFKISPSADSKFGYVILWCGSAGIPFGYTQLK